MRVTLDDTVYAGDTVVTRMTWTGIHRGAFMGLPAYGRRVSWTAISIIRLSGGKIAQALVNEDTLGLLHQIGGVVEARSGRSDCKAILRVVSELTIPGMWMAERPHSSHGQRGMRRLIC